MYAVVRDKHNKDSNATKLFIGSGLKIEWKDKREKNKEMKKERNKKETKKELQNSVIFT
jgi:hypothetical protein